MREFGLGPVGVALNVSDTYLAEAAEAERLGYSAVRLADELVIWGDADTVAERISRQLQAGADHVMLQVLSGDGQPGPIEAARSLASRLPG